MTDLATAWIIAIAALLFWAVSIHGRMELGKSTANYAVNEDY